jgi:dGTPase
MLSHLRLTRDLARGRKYPEPAHAYRNDYQRDRDRVIHSRAFRRLEGKTQVFAPSLSDHFRNRLTHTLEVAQIARTVATVLQLNEEFTETLALAHDIGHPPFAHSGEHELDRQMQRFGSRFEHNLHSLRLVDRLEQRYARFDGLNLTFEVREGIVKHSREVTADDGPELEEFFPGLKPPLEAQLLDIADEIAYNTADLDDAYSAGLVTVDDIGQAVPLFAEHMDAVQNMYPGASERIQFHETQRFLINHLVSGFIEGTYREAEASGAKDVWDVRYSARRLATMTSEGADLNGRLKALLTERVYQCSPLIGERSFVGAKVAALFNYFMEHPDSISEGFREQLEGEPRERLVCDYIAGMTDAFFLKTYSALLDANDQI